MDEIVLPPAPNWYLSNILACSNRGTVAWGSKNYVVVAKRKEDSPILHYTLLRDFSKNKVNSLAFCPKVANSDGSDCPELLICGGDDDKVKIWNTDTSDVVMEFNLCDGKPIVAVDWSVKDDNLAYAINSEGFLVCCNIQYKTMKKISLGKLVPTCMACCPHDMNLIAIGGKNGLIYIVQKETILYRMRGHDKEIVSLSWCPSEMNVLNKSNQKDLLLASGAKDRFVYIWKAGSDGRYEAILNLSHQPTTSQSTNSSQNRKFVIDNWIHISVCWVKPNVLLTSSPLGEVLYWDLSVTNPTYKYKFMPQVFHAYHNSKGVFCIVNVPKHNLTTDTNWRTNSELMVWTLAQDRWIICCRKSGDESVIIEYKIPAQGGYVYCMEACSIDTSRIAFGVGDMMLRLWNSSEPHKTIFDITIYWQKIKGKIRALSWMPNEESVIAFGTSEGRIGVFDAIGTNKLPILFRQYHRNTVYKLEWAQPEADYLLFSCAEGELIAYNKSAPQDEPKSIIKEGCTEFSWKSNLCLAVALENGSITFYNQKLKKCNCSIHVLRNVVNCLTWHPESTAMDEWISPFANYLAVASDSHSIIIFDMSDLIKKLETTKDHSEEEENNSEQDDQKLYKIVTTLEGHSDKVVCLAWSPHLSGFLVSGGYDNIAQVWNIEKQELLGTFMGHDGPVLSCMWSPLKSHLIITGSVDFTLRVWDYTSPAQTPVRPSEIKSAKKKHKQQKSQKKVIKNEIDNSETHSINLKDSQPTNGQTTEIVKSDNSQVLIPLKDAQKKKEKKYFMKYNSLLNNSTNVLDFIKNDIRNNQEQNETNDDNIKISLFSKQTDFMKYLAMESSDHYARGNINTAAELDIWRDNLHETLMTAVKDYRLNDFLVSLAPNISMNMWKQMCEVYAQQLILEGNIEKAVSYLLCIHKIYEAIQTFVNAKMYKEAYALARCKLDADDPVLKSTLKSWAEGVSVYGHLEQAAHCYVQLEQFEKAAQILARRKNVYSLELASELAFLSGDEGYGTSLIVDAMTRALIKLDWSKARSLITQIRKIQYLNIYIDAHEAIMSTYQKQTKLDTIRTWLKGTEELGVLQTLANKYDVSYIETLRNNANTNVVLKNDTDDTMIHLSTSYQIAIAAMYDTREAQLHHVAEILRDVFEYEETSAKIALKCDINKAMGFFMHIITRLDTKKPTEETSIYAKSDNPVSQSIRAYLCIGLLNWLLEIEELSVEEETQLTQIILDLLDDAINETTLAYQKLICDHKKVKDLYVTLLFDMPDNMTDDDDYKKVKNDFDKLQLDKKKFTEERVGMPNPMNVFHIACLVADKLHDSINHFRLLYYLDKLVKTTKTKLSETEENTLKKLEDLSLKIDEDVLKRYTDEIES